MKLLTESWVIRNPVPTPTIYSPIKRKKFSETCFHGREFDVIAVGVFRNARTQLLTARRYTQTNRQSYTAFWNWSVVLGERRRQIICPSAKLWTVGKFLDNFHPKNAKFNTKNRHSKATLKFWAPAMFSVEHLQLSVGITSEICSGCRKKL